MRKATIQKGTLAGKSDRRPPTRKGTPVKAVSLGVVTLALLLLAPAESLLACNSGAPGGADYVPQRRGAPQQNQPAKRQALTPEQAQQIVSRYIKPINGDLTVGNPNDAGSYYEVDIFSKDGEVVQVIGVDKFTGRMQPLS